MKIGDTELIAVHGVLIPAVDNCATTHIRARGRLDWDDQFNVIPEIAGLKSGQVVFDVGAWIGDTTQTFLKLGCEVHAFEPRPDNFVCLLHNCPEAHCYNLALGNGERVATDKRGGNTGAYSLLAGNQYSVKLDDLNVQRLDFLKLDVEGFEISALLGARNTIRTFHPTVHVECNDAGLVKFGWKSDDVLKLLCGLGYEEFRRVFHYSDSQTDWICK